MRIDLTGKVFGRWTAISVAGLVDTGLLWNCVCKCGARRVVLGSSLRNKRSRSCGCLKRERLAGLHTTHGHSHKVSDNPSPTYYSWRNMIQRCTNPNHNRWKNYGGATPPVTVCSRWMKFANFYRDMLTRPAGTTLGRYLDNGSYTKSNCAWMTPAEQGVEQRKKRGHFRTPNVQGDKPALLK